MPVNGGFDTGWPTGQFVRSWFESVDGALLAVTFQREVLRFRNDRWDYFYMMHKAGELAEQRAVTVIFRGDELLRIEGDVAVAAPAQPAAVPAAAKPASAPAATEQK